MAKNETVKTESSGHMEVHSYEVTEQLQHDISLWMHSLEVRTQEIIEDVVTSRVGDLRVEVDGLRKSIARLTGEVRDTQRKKTHQLNVCLSNVPNFYRKLDASHTHYDATHQKLEKCVSLLVMFVIVVSLAILALTYWDHTYIGHVFVAQPTEEEYHGMLTRTDVIGDIDCRCSTPLISNNVEKGGYISSIKYDTDSWCGVAGEPPLMTAVEQIEKLGVFRVNPNTGATTSDEPWAYACGFAGQGPDALKHRKSCAALWAVFIKISDHLGAACATTATANAVTASDFLNAEGLVEFLLPPPQLFSYLESVLTEITHRMRASASILPSVYTMAKSIEATFLETAFDALVADGESADRFDAEACYSYTFGKGAGSNASLHDVLVSCRLHQYIQGWCCADKDFTNCTTNQLPCSSDMQTLAGRLDRSDFGTLREAAEGSFLGTFSKASSVGYSRTVGFYIDEDEEVFAKYFAACHPQSCKYMFKEEKVYGLTLALVALVGGVTTAARMGGSVLVNILRREAASH